MEGYINFDRQIDLHASLEELLVHARTSFDSTRACKWALISAHSALQASMCMALRGSAGFDTWKPNHLKKWLEAYEKGDELPDPQLDFFMDLFDKLFSEDSGLDRHLIKWLNETRNGLIHFNTDSYSIEKASIIAAISESMKAVAKTPDLSTGIFFYEEGQVETFNNLCNEIAKKMENHEIA
ncbi:hypothetical protein QP938_02265 [Porticoccaceae bacterium LTM1]|nr:hypothetical protein QP938_02265 [Porticoccaceae bacterium LTM1]